MALPKTYKPEKPARKAEPTGQAALEPKGTDAGPAKATKRENKRKGGKEKHGKARTATQHETETATGN